MGAQFIIRCILGFSLVLSTSSVFSAPKKSHFIPNSPVGLWRTVDDKTNKVRSLVRIWRSNGVYYGRIVRIFKQPGDTGICSKCPGRFKDKPILGMTILWGLERTGVNEWSNGSILDPKSGNVYRVILRLSENKRMLRVRGYIGFSLFGRTQNWFRAD